MRKFRVITGSYIVHSIQTVKADSPREAWRAAVWDDKTYRGTLVDIEPIVPTAYDDDDDTFSNAWEVVNGAGRSIGTIVEA